VCVLFNESVFEVFLKTVSVGRRRQAKEELALLSGERAARAEARAVPPPSPY